MGVVFGGRSGDFLFLEVQSVQRLAAAHPCSSNCLSRGVLKNSKDLLQVAQRRLSYSSVPIRCWLLGIVCWFVVLLVAGFGVVVGAVLVWQIGL